MDRKLETVFDTVGNLQAATLDVNHMSDLCKEQQRLTMRRIAGWLRNNARIYELGFEVSIAKQIDGLAGELEYLAEVSKNH